MRKNNHSIKSSLNHNSSSTHAIQSGFPKHVQKRLRSMAGKINALILTLTPTTHWKHTSHSFIYHKCSKSFGFMSLIVFLFIIRKLLPSEKAVIIFHGRTLKYFLKQHVFNVWSKFLNIFHRSNCVLLG